MTNRIAHPQDLKVGDIVKCISNNGLYNDPQQNLKVGHIYKVYKIEPMGKYHMAVNSGYSVNPMLKTMEGQKAGSAWWGTLEYALYELQPYGIVKFCKQFYEKETV